PTAGHEYAVVAVSDATTFDLVAVVQADADGDYQAAVPPGTYSVAFMDPTGAYDPEYYQDAQFPAFDPVTVTAGAVADVDLVVSQPLPNNPSNPGDIVGTVTEPAGPAAGTWVVAVDSTGRVRRAVQADPAG